MFKEYKSRPITRKACKIKSNFQVSKVNDAEATWLYKEGEEQILFKAHQTPAAGDYIVYLNEDDVYHCDKTTFEERNIVEE